jgi:hypothetical protein
MRTKTHILHLPLWHKISTRVLFYAIATSLVLTFALYAYLVNKTIMNVVAREKTEREIASLSSSIGELEFKYMTAKNNITLDLAYAHGFHDATPSKFISRKAEALSLNTR